MHACAMKEKASKMWKANSISIKRLVLVEDRRRSVRVEVLDVDQQQGVRVLERQPQAARAVGERDVVQPGVDLGARLLAVDVHLVIEDLACVDVFVVASMANYRVLLLLLSLPLPLPLPLLPPPPPPLSLKEVEPLSA